MQEQPQRQPNGAVVTAGDNQVSTDEVGIEGQAPESPDAIDAAASEAAREWLLSVPEETRGPAMEAFVETGEITEAAGMSEAQVGAIEAGIRHKAESTLSPLGIDPNLWGRFVSDEDMPAFRRALIQGDWAMLTDHARRVASLVHSGQVDSEFVEDFREAGCYPTEVNGKWYVVIDGKPMTMSEAIKSRRFRFPE